MNNKPASSVDESELQPWISMIDDLSKDAVNLTVGLIAGNREPIERRALDVLAQSAFKNLESGGLLVRLNFGSELITRRQLRTAKASEQPPVSVPSVHGSWREITLTMPSSLIAPRSLERLPRWLAGWKKESPRIVLDLGPLDQPVCRMVGRYCDTCLIVLGPHGTASPSWLRRHIDHLTQCDANLSGSILVAGESLAAAG